MHYTVRRYVIIAAVVMLTLLVMATYHQNLQSGYESMRDTIVDKTADVVQGVKPQQKQTILASELSAKNPPPEPQDDYISACLAVKNQHIDLPEWMHHHYYHMGVGRFFIMDDGSSPRMDTTNLTIPRDKVEFHYYEPEKHIEYMQYHLYSECVRIVREYSKAAAEAAKNTTAPEGVTPTANVNVSGTVTAVPATYTAPTWMAFFDTDEFLDATANQTLRDLLEEYEPIQAIGGFGINWRLHTSDGNLQRPPTVLGSYFECVVDTPDHHNRVSTNKHIKSIVRVSAFDRAYDPHSFVLNGKAVTVGEYGDVIGGTPPVESDHVHMDAILGSAFRTPITRDRFALHHYSTMSRAEFETKMQRGNAMSSPKGWDFWEEVHNGTDHAPCREMLRWAKPAPGQAEP